VLQLAHPLLLILLPLPWLVARILPPHRQRLIALHVPFLDRLAELTGRRPGQGEQRDATPRSQQVVGCLAWLLILLAMARPQWLEDPIVETLPMRDLLIAVDLSGSMETEDFTDAEGRTVDRLSAVQEVLREFLARREDDRIALVVFGSAAFVQVPFTEDNEVVAQLLDETTVRMAGPRTMLGDAIGLAITLFDRSEIDERMMILLTDGNDTGSQIPPQRAAEIARDKGVVIHTIGVGDPTAAGEEALDEEALEAIAETTGGHEYHAQDRAELESIYDELDRLAPRKVETLSHRPQRDLFEWPLGGALVLSLLYHGFEAMSRPWRRRARRQGIDRASRENGAATEAAA
jgi:Ca-activated chloride channel family protein